MAKSADWDTIKYEFSLYRKTRAFKRHVAILVSAVVLTVGVLATRWALTSTGPAAAMKEARAKPKDGVPRELRGPNEFAGALGSRLRDEKRFDRIVAVPMAPRGRSPQVMIQGQVASDADMASLREVVQKLNPPVPIDWQVLIVEGHR